MIKKTSPVFLFSIGIFLSGLPLWADPPSLVGRINFLSGTVSANAGSVGEWSPANLNYPLTTGDGLWVDTGSKAEVQAGSTVLRLGPETDFGFTNLSDGVLQVRLSQGLLNVTVREFDNGDTVEIDSPNSTTLVQSPGSYQVSVGPNGDTLVQVNQGKADVHSGTYDFTVAPHQLATVTSIDKPRYLLENAPGPSEWDLWVQDRDQKALRAPTLRYVSQDTIGYEDLDDNGTWENLPPYGWVWSPNRVAADWAPYHDGHWSWIEPWGWTWIDNATWGFAPFHYGRWASSHSRWYWIPGDRASRQVYAPALVVFLGGDSWGAKVGWFPLGFHEEYVPPYAASREYQQNLNRGPGTVVQSVTRTTVTKNVYVNINITHAVTVVPRRAFVTSKPMAPASVEVTRAQLDQVPITKVSQIKPRKESVGIPPTTAPGVISRPPAALETRKVVQRRTPPPAPVRFADRQPAAKDPAPRPSPAVSPRSAIPPQGSKAPAPRPAPAAPNRQGVPKPVPQRPAAAAQPPQHPSATPQTAVPRPRPAQSPQSAKTPSTGQGPQRKPAQPPKPQAPAKVVPDQKAKDAANSSIVSTRNLSRDTSQKLSEAKKVKGSRQDFGSADQKVSQADSLLNNAH